MSTKPLAPPATRFNSINEVYRSIYENRGFDAQTIYRLTVTGNTELLVEMTCLLLDRYPNIKPGAYPTPTNLPDNSSPSHGHQYSELKLLRYLGLNQGYITQSVDYPPLFYALCVADHLDVVDFFRILRSRTDWTSVTFRQAWLDSEFRAFKQWFVTTMVHIPPAQYHFHFFAKLYELMFRPKIDAKGNKIHGDVMLAWIQPQILLPAQPGGDFSWAADIFGPFDTSTTQQFINTYYQTIIDSCITAGNWTAFSIFLSSYHFTDISTPPKVIEESPRRMIKSGQAYDGKKIVDTVSDFLKTKKNNFYDGTLSQQLSTVVPANLTATGLPLPKQIREYILTARPLIFYLHLIDMKQEIVFLEKLQQSLMLENDYKILNLITLREEKFESLVSLYQDVTTKLTEKTALRAQEIIPALATLQTQRHDVEKMLQKGVYDDEKIQNKDEAIQILEEIHANILSLQLEFQNLQDLASLLNDDCKTLVEEINDITETIGVIRMKEVDQVNKYKAKMNSYELLINYTYEFFIAFVALFGLDFAYPQDLFALQTVACMNNDLVLLNVLVDHNIPFHSNQNALTLEDISSYSTQLDEVTSFNEEIKDKFDAAIDEKMAQDDSLTIEAVRESLGEEFSSQMKSLPTTLVSLDFVNWNFNYRDHIKAASRTGMYIDGLPSLTMTHTIEQNIDFLTLQFLGSNLTNSIETMMKHLQKNKIILPKPPVITEKKDEKKDDKKGKDGKATLGKKKKGAPPNPGDMLSSMMGMGPAKNKSPLPDPIEENNDDDDDFFGGVGKIKAIGVSADKPVLDTATATAAGIKLRKILNINDLSTETNYVAFVCATAPCRPSTLRWLLQKKAKVYSNSKGPQKDKANAFLMCLVNSYASVENLDEMLLMLFEYCANPTAFAPPVVKKTTEKDGEENKTEEKAGPKFNPGLTVEEYSSVLGHLWLKIHAPNGTQGLLPPELMSYKVNNSYNIHYQDRSELILHVKRLAPANLNTVNPMAMFGGMGMGGPKGGKNSVASRQWLDLIINTCKPEFFYQTYDISIHAQQNESFVYHHRRHVVHVEDKMKNDQSGDDILNDFELYYKTLMSVTKDDINNFPYAQYPSCLTTETKSPQNGYYGYAGSCDAFDPYQRLALENPSDNDVTTTEDHIYMKSNPFKSSFLYGFHKDVCLFFTHIFFGDNEHRAIIGNVANKSDLSQLVQYAIAMRCYPVLQFFTNHGFVPDASDLSFCFYTNTSTFWLADVNYEEAFFKNVKRQDFITNFQKLVAWKTKYPAGEESDIRLQQERDAEKKRIEDEEKQMREEEARARRLAEEEKKNKPTNVDDVDGITTTTISAEEVPFDPFAHDDMDAKPFDPFAHDDDDEVVPVNDDDDVNNDDEKTSDDKNVVVDDNKETIVAEKEEEKTLEAVKETKKTGKKKAQAKEKEPEAVVVNVELPAVFEKMTAERSDFYKYLEPFSLLPGTPARRLIVQSTNPIYTKPYFDTAVVTPGFYIAYGRQQQFAMRSFQLDCDYYFQRQHHVNTKALHELVTKFYYDDAVVKHPAVVEQIVDIVGTASRLGIPGAVDYDVKFLFKDPAGRNEEKNPKNKKKITQTATLEEFDPATDYTSTFLLEAVHLMRMFQSLYHHTRSNNFSPLYQCFLTLSNAIPRLGQALEDAVPVSTWAGGSALMGYIWSLTRSDPFNSKDFADPTSMCSAFFLRYTGPAVTRNFDRLAKMVAVYTTPGPMRIRAISTIIEENMALHTETMLTCVQQQSQIMEQQQQMEMMAQAGPGGQPNPAMMQRLMMQGGQMQQQMKQIERQMAESAIETTSFFVVFCNAFGYRYTDMTQVDLVVDDKFWSPKDALFPQSVLKNFVLNPMLMKACPHKYIFYDMISLYRSTNSDRPYTFKTAQQQPRHMDRQFTQYQEVLLQLTRNSIQKAQLTNQPYPFKSIDFDRPAETVSLACTIQPVHYMAMTLYQTFMSIMQIEHMKGTLNQEFEQRAQRVRSQKEMEQLQGEFQAMVQQIHQQEKAIEASLYTDEELKIIEGIIDHSLDQNVVHQLMVEMGADEIQLDENGQPVDPAARQAQEDAAKGKKKKGPDEYEQVENVLKNVMIARTSKQKSWFSGLFSTALAATGIAAVASVAYVAYKYWNGSWSNPAAGMFLGKKDAIDNGKDDLSKDDLAFSDNDVTITTSAPISTPTAAPAVAPAPAKPKPFKVTF